MNEREEYDETVFGADFKILEPTGKGPAPRLKNRPEPKKKPRTLATKSTSVKPAAGRRSS